MKAKRSEMWRAGVLLLFMGCVCASVPEEPADRASPSDGYCSWITRAQPHGAGGRRESTSEFRLRVEGDPEHYQPGSTYRGTCHCFSCCQDHQRGQRCFLCARRRFVLCLENQPVSFIGSMFGNRIAPLKYSFCGNLTVFSSCTFVMVKLSVFCSKKNKQTKKNYLVLYQFLYIQFTITTITIARVQQIKTKKGQSGRLKCFVKDNLYFTSVR